MNLSKCDKCGNRNIMCFLCENNKHYRETKYSYDRVIRNNTIDEFISRLEKHTQENWIDHQEYGITWADIEQIAEQMKGGSE